MRPLATIFRDMRDLFEELAQVLEREAPQPLAKGGPRKCRGARPVERPAGESDELSRAHARKILRKIGCTEVDR